VPEYEFFCNDCKKKFSKILTLAGHDKEKIACPRCGSKKVEQSWSAISAITAQTSA
jgi:putative FmdB family regulatory protein